MGADGAAWYRREPRKWLAGTRGLTAVQHAVYSVVIDLIYDNGGPIPNDPKFVAGHIADVGPAAARNAIRFLLETPVGDDEPRLSLTDDGRITNRKAEAVVVTTRQKSARNAASGRAGGIASGEARRAIGQQDMLDQLDYTLIERLRIAMGYDRDGENGSGRAVLGVRDEEIARRWQDDLGLSEREIVNCVAHIASNRRGAIASLRYFQGPIEELAASKRAAPMIPPTHAPPAARHRRAQQHQNIMDAFIGGAADDDD